ncbi:DUF1232 domain-containing protein [Lentibacillus sp. N15]|uniref:DUF1232 domain-containing protein n=1 Tax=Lentibacillus songyuanensis TaxID=3136161 RepID=UPI0031B9AD19
MMGENENHQPNQLGRILKHLLDKHSLSMRRLSDLTKIDTATISRIINGKRKATLEHLARFSDCLDISMNRLLDAAGYEMNPEKHAADEHNQYMEHIQRLFHASSPDVSIDQISNKLTDYEKYVQTEDGKTTIFSGFEEKLKKIDSVGPFINHLKNFYERFRFKNGSPQALTLIGSALLYFIIPVDVVPDYLFPIGYLDDAVAVQLVMNVLEKEG